MTEAEPPGSVTMDEAASDGKNPPTMEEYLQQKSKHLTVDFFNQCRIACVSVCVLLFLSVCISHLGPRCHSSAAPVRSSAKGQPMPVLARLAPQHMLQEDLQSPQLTAPGQLSSTGQTGTQETGHRTNRAHRINRGAEEPPERRDVVSDAGQWEPVASTDSEGPSEAGSSGRRARPSRDDCVSSVLWTLAVCGYAAVAVTGVCVFTRGSCGMRRCYRQAVVVASLLRAVQTGCQPLQHDHLRQLVRMADLKAARLAARGEGAATYYGACYGLV